MRILLLLLLTGSCLLAISANDAWAQGKGNGASKSLGSLGRAASKAKTSQAAKGLSRAGTASTRLSKGLGSSNGGLGRANAALDRVPDLDGFSADLDVPFEAESFAEPTIKNQRRILDHRLGQAEHLRAIAAKNGNEHLLETADRMEASAITNFQRQTNTIYDPEAEITEAPSYEIPTKKVNKPPRGFWFRSR